MPLKMVPAHGFDWTLVSWGGPDEPAADSCSYCDADIRSTLKYQHFELEDMRRALELLAEPPLSRNSPEAALPPPAKRRRSR